MIPDERDRLTRVETQMGDVRESLAEIKRDLRAIRNTLEQARGGWKALALIGGLSGAAGALLTKLSPLWAGFK